MQFVNGQARFKGVNMAYISKNGYDSPAANLPYEAEFSHTFPGGLLYTCGLRTTGSAHRDGNEWQPAHGRYHGLSAEPIAVALEDDCAVIKGAIRETALFGCNLEVKRTIRIPLMGAEIHVEDAITNLGFRRPLRSARKRLLARLFPARKNGYFSTKTWSAVRPWSMRPCIPGRN